MVRAPKGKPKDAAQITIAATRKILLAEEKRLAACERAYAKGDYATADNLLSQTLISGGKVNRLVMNVRQHIATVIRINEGYPDA